MGSIESKLSKLNEAQTVYTTAAALTVTAGESVVVEGDGGITLATPLVDGSEITLLDPYRRIRVGKNTVALSPGDRFLLADGTYSTTALAFTDNALLGGLITFKYALATKSWSSFITYGSPLQGESKVQIGGAEIDAINVSIAKLPTTATTDAIKADVAQLKTDLAALDTSKADAVKLTAVDTAVKAVEASLKTLSELPANATKAELDAAIADYTAKLKVANDAIALLPTVAITDAIKADVSTLKADTAKLKTDLTALATRVTVTETVNTSQNARLDALEGKDYNLDLYSLDGGWLFTAFEQCGLLSFVHLRADGKFELAHDGVQDKPANAIVLSTVAANGTSKLYGNGAALSDLGITGVNVGARIYLGANGVPSLNTAGTNRLIQCLGVFRGGKFWLTFDDPGYWVAA